MDKYPDASVIAVTAHQYWIIWISTETVHFCHDTDKEIELKSNWWSLVLVIRSVLVLILIRCIRSVHPHHFHWWKYSCIWQNVPYRCMVMGLEALSVEQFPSHSPWTKNNHTVSILCSRTPGYPSIVFKTIPDAHLDISLSAVLPEEWAKTN